MANLLFINVFIFLATSKTNVFWCWKSSKSHSIRMKCTCGYVIHEWIDYKYDFSCTNIGSAKRFNKAEMYNIRNFYWNVPVFHNRNKIVYISWLLRIWIAVRYTEILLLFILFQMVLFPQILLHILKTNSSKIFTTNICNECFLPEEMFQDYVLIQNSSLKISFLCIITEVRHLFKSVGHIWPTSYEKGLTTFSLLS